MRGRELVRRGKLDHGFYLALIQYRQRNDVTRARADEAAAHVDEILRNVFEQQALSVRGCLAYDALAQRVAARCHTDLWVRIRGQLLEIAAALTGFDDVHDG